MPPGYGTSMTPSASAMSPGTDAELRRDTMAVEAAMSQLAGGATPPQPAAAYGTQSMMPPMPPGTPATGTMQQDVVYASTPSMSPSPSGMSVVGTGYSQNAYSSSPSGMPYQSSGPQGLGSMGVQEANDLFIQIKEGGEIPTNDDARFNESCQQLEDAFMRLDLTQISAMSGDAGLSSATVAQNAVKAIKVMVNSIVNGWDMIQKAIADIALSELNATETTSNVNRWKTAGYMLAAAASNVSFRKELATQTLKDAAPTFWTAVDKVFSIQPVSLRRPDGTGRFIEVASEQELIQDLFRTTQQLTESISKDGISEGSEEAKFVAGTRAFTNIIIRPAFANGSIGLQIFAFRIFNEGILKRLKDFGLVTARHDELYCVTAEAFNIMYSGLIGPSMRPARKPAGINRASGFGTDHITFNFSKGSMAQALRSTYLPKYDTNLKKIADTLIKRVSAVGKIGNMISKSASDLLVLMMCSEACEYIMNVSSAADAANLINYFYEKGFSFNNRYANWDELTPQGASWTIIVLNRLKQKTATSRLTTALGISGARNSLYGDYTVPDVYQGLQQAFTTIIAAKAKFPQVNTKTAQLAPILRNDNAELRKYMLAKKELKNLRARTPVFVIDRVDTTAIPIPMQTATMINTGTVPGYNPQIISREAPGRMITPVYGSAGYGTAAPVAVGYRAPAQVVSYGQQSQMVTRSAPNTWASPRYGAPVQQQRTIVYGSSATAPF